MGRRKDNDEPYGMAEQFLADRYTRDPDSPIAWELWLRYWREEWYTYANGRYTRVTPDLLKADVVGFLRQQKQLISQHSVAAIILCLTHLCLLDPNQELDAWVDGINGAEVITAINGNVSLTDRDENGRPRLLLHTARYFTLSRLPYEYCPDAECPLWLTFLSDIMQGNEQYLALLQEWAGYLFRRDLREQKFLLCVGEGANGKGVYFDMHEALVGADNTSHVPLVRFDNPFALYSTLGKRVNMTSEAIGMIEEHAESQLKTFVAGDAMTFERKFLTAVETRPTAKMMIATNTLRRFSDRTWGTWRRILLVPFNVTITEDRQIKGLAAELKKELPGILNWAIAGLDRLNHNGGFTIPGAHAALLEEYRQDADPCRAFLYERYTFSPNAYGATTEEVYAAYRRFCEANGYSPLHERNFGHEVRRIFPGTERRRMGPRDDRHYVYAGLIHTGEHCVSHVSQGNSTLAHEEANI